MADVVFDLDPILEQVQGGDPVGAAYKLEQTLGKDAPGRAFYEAGSIALARRDELGEEALRFARLAFAEAVDREPDLGEAHHDLATTMRELGMAEDAVKQYRRALEIMPDDVDCLIGLGASLCEAGKMDEGIRSLEHAVEKHPESGPAYANLGLAFEAAGRDEAAAGAYAKAVARFDAAVQHAATEDAAEEMAARRRWARVQYAEMLERLEKWPQAIIEFRRLYEEEQAAEAAEDDEEDDEDADEDETEAADGSSEVAKRGPGVKEILDDGAVAEAHDHAHDHDHDDHDHDHDHDHGDEGHEHDDELLDGRRGLERLFSLLVQAERLDLAFLVLDDLGGELADERTRATYAIYDSGDAPAAIMVEHWDTGERERLDP